MLNVTEVHLAHRCPRLLAYQVSGQTKAWKVGLSSTGNFPSTLFHNKVANPFHQQACGAQPGPLFKALADLMAQPGGDLEKRLPALLDRLVLLPLLDEQAGSLKSDQIAALVLAIESWGRLLARFLTKWARRTPGIKPGDVFCQAEEIMKTRFALPGGGDVLLKGKFDGLLLDPVEKEAVIVEFKGFRPQHADEDMIQVALYALLLRHSLGVVPRSVVLYMEEEEIEAEYTADDLSGLEENLLYLLEEAAKVKAGAKRIGQVNMPTPSDRDLCGQCPFDSTCDADWGARRGSRIDVSPTDIGKKPDKPVEPREKSKVEEPGWDKFRKDKPGKDKKDDQEQEAKRLLDLLTRTLVGIKLPVQPVGYVIGPKVYRLMIEPDMQKGATVAKIMNKAHDLQIALKLKTAPFIGTGPGYLSVDVPRKRPEPLLLGRVWEDGQANRPSSKVAFPLGVTVDGNIFWADLSHPTMTSMLVAGTAGSGKSVFLKSVILGLARGLSPEEIRFTLIDPKLVTFGDIQDLPHVEGPLIHDVEEAMQVLEGLVAIMDKRYLSMAECGVVDITGYNQKFDPIPHHVIVIDEYADLMVDRKIKKDAENLVQRLGQKGRAAGIHIILSTQRPDAKVVTPLIKANLQLMIALKVTNEANSKIILDEPGANNLLGNGDMLVGGAVPLMRLQGPLSTRSDIEAVIGK